MERGTLKKLTNSILDHNERCHVNIDVWHPSIKEIKFLLNLGHDRIDSNNTSDTCTIFGIEFDRYGPDKAPALKITLFCEKDAEAKFMRKYIKQREEVNI